jgi:hypothetical protein
MPSEADRLAAEGTRVDGADGGEVALRFTLRALKRCEDRYGTLDGTVSELQWLVDQDARGNPEPVADRLLAMVEAVTGIEGVDTGSNVSQVISALLGAWLEAFPAPEGKAEGETTAPPSRGTPGGASPSPTAT